MLNPRRIAADAMGGNIGVNSNVPAPFRASHNHNELQLALGGDQQRIMTLLGDLQGQLLSRTKVIHSDHRIPGDLRPQSVLYASRRPFKYLAVDLSKQGEANAVVGAGDAGALLMASRRLLKTFCKMLDETTAVAEE